MMAILLIFLSMMILVFHLNIKKISLAGQEINNFKRTLELPSINCEINLVLTLSENCILKSGGIDNLVPKFAIIGTKILAVTLSTQENVKLLD